LNHRVKVFDDDGDDDDYDSIFNNAAKTSAPNRSLNSD